MAAVLVGAAPQAVAQATGPVTEAQARQYIFGGFLTGAAHAILSRNVALDAALRARLALPPDADSNQIYEALIRLTENKQLSVRRARAEEVTQYSPGAGRALRDPLYTLQAGDVVLLIQYDLVANNIPFIGDLAPVAITERALPPVPERPKPAVVEKPKPVAVEKPKPVAVEKPKPVVVEKPKPVVVEKPKPVVVEKPQPAVVETPRPVVLEKPAPVVTPAPAAVVPPPAPVVVTPPPAPPKPPVAQQRPPVAAPVAVERRPVPVQPNGPCLVKPVMSDQDLANCGATILR